MTFLNKGYYLKKSEFIANIKEIQKKCEISKEKQSNLKEKLKSLCVDYKETEKYLEVKRECDRLNNLEKQLEVNSKKIENLDRECLEIMKKMKDVNVNYDQQISEFENLISHLESKVKLGYKKYDLFENQMKLIKNDIKEKRRTMQNFMGKDEKSKGKENLMESYIKRIKNKLVETSKYDETYDLTKSNEFLRFSYRSNNNPLKQNIQSNNENNKHKINSDSKRESKSQNKIITNLKRKDYNNRYKANCVLSNDNLNEESFFEQNDSSERSKFSKTTNTRTNGNKFTKSFSQVELKSDSINNLNKNISSPQSKNSQQLKNNRDSTTKPKFDFNFKDTKDSWNGKGKVSYSSRCQLKSSLSNNLIKSLNKVNYITQRDRISSEDILIIEKLRHLIKGAKCLIRLKNRNEKLKYEEFDPFISYKETEIFDRLKFKNSFISLDKSLKKLNFDKTSSCISYLLTDIINIEVSKKMRDIINVAKFYQHSSSVRTNLINQYNIFDQHLLISQEYEQRCLSARYFLLCLSFNRNFKIEIIFLDLNEFKSWAKNLDFVINNLQQISFLQNKI